MTYVFKFSKEIYSRQSKKICQTELHILKNDERFQYTDTNRRQDYSTGQQKNVEVQTEYVLRSENKIMH